MRFIDLLNANSQLSPAEQQQRASEQFSSVVKNSRMKVWRLREQFPAQPARTCIAVASYSVSDLEILDALEAKLASNSTRNEIIYLFDLAASPEFSDFEKYLPGIGKVYQTPVIGFWEGGILKEKASGASAKNWLVRHYEL